MINTLNNNYKIFRFKNCRFFVTLGDILKAGNNFSPSKLFSINTQTAVDLGNKTLKDTSFEEGFDTDCLLFYEF